jgi:hypothetical protein
MNAELKAKWVAALRSGVFNQCRGALQERDKETDKVVGNCCLGVLNVIRGVSNDKEQYIELNHLLEDPYGTASNGSRLRAELASLNDGKRYTGENFTPKTFAEIANFIETSVPVDLQPQTFSSHVSEVA